jgi:hypothetical protein
MQAQCVAKVNEVLRIVACAGCLGVRQGSASGSRGGKCRLGATVSGCVGLTRGRPCAGKAKGGGVEARLGRGWGMPRAGARTSSAQPDLYQRRHSLRPSCGVLGRPVAQSSAGQVFSMMGRRCAGALHLGDFVPPVCPPIRSARKKRRAAPAGGPSIVVPWSG